MFGSIGLNNLWDATSKNLLNSGIPTVEMVEFTDEEMFFGGPQLPEAPKHEKIDPFTAIRNSVNDIERRLRVLEERYSNLRKKIQITDQNRIDNENQFSKAVLALNETVIGLKVQVEEIGEKISIFNSEFENLAKKRDLRMLEKYLDMWQPMNFVSREEFSKVIGKKLTE